jgi:hypothetical protein
MRQGPAPGHGQPAAERVLVGGRGVDQFQPGRQVADDQAVALDRARDNLDAVGGEHVPGDGVAGFFHAGPVAGL